jgi:hypothetical protein
MTNRTRLLVLIGLVAGATARPTFAQSGDTTISDPTITKAGHAFHDVSMINRDYNARYQNTADPSARQQIVTEDYQRGAEAVARNGLTLNEYNQVLAVAQQNPAVRQRLLAVAQMSR